jgi:phosphoribosylanthranilate isomerase
VTEIKICGITNMEDASYVAQCGADAIGFIFYPKSPRYVAPETAKKIIETITTKITTVGVFVNHDVVEVKETIDFCGLDMVQLHGDESPAYCGQFPRSQVIKAFALRTEDDLENMKEYPVKAILVDAYHPQHHGGTGEQSDWILAAKVKGTHPLILAGGLSMTNIQEAIEHASPHAVDINSGAELSPGKKDHQKIKAIIELVYQLGGEDAGIFVRDNHDYSVI